MAQIRIAVAGGSGRMGRALVEAAHREGLRVVRSR